MWQHEAEADNGMEEGLGDSSESAPIAFSKDMHTEMENETIRNNPTGTRFQLYKDQMVPSMTSSLVRVEDEETYTDLRNSVDDNRAEVPININVAEEPRREPMGHAIMSTIRTNNAFAQFNFTRGRRNYEDSTAESSSSSRRERDRDVVPIMSP